MDLLVKTLIIALVIIVALYGIYYVFQNNFTQSVTEQQAVSLVTSDLQNSHPTAIINVTNVTPSRYAGSWHIVTSIIFNSTTPCPSYYIWSFDYPKYGFVNTTENDYTSGCVVYGLRNQSYIIASYPVAIARSYSLNLSNVRGFVSKYGFNNVVVKAIYYNSTSFNYTSYGHVWIVNYSAPEVNTSAYVVLNRTGGSVLSAVNETR